MPGLNQLLHAAKIGDGKILTGAKGLAPQTESVADFQRIPTYILPFDYATGGGIPCNVLASSRARTSRNAARNA